MKIAVLTDGIYPYVLGGMQKHSYNLVRYLAKLGVDIILYHCVPEGKNMPDNLEGFNQGELEHIEHKCFYFPSLDKYPGHYLRESYKLSEEFHESLLNEEDIDLIYAQGFMAWSILKKKPDLFNKIPIIVNFHGLEMFQKAASIKTKLEHFLLRPSVINNLQNADYSISLGGGITDILRSKIKDDKIIINSIGIEDKWISSNPIVNDVRQIVFIGRNERRKGIKELNIIINRIDDLDFNLHIIGPFNKDDQIIDGKIKYYGEINNEDEIASVLSKMDVLVLPSWSEGMPTVILEAMAKGCAIVANDVGAVSELVDDSNGWLCEVGNNKSLEDNLRKAILLPSNELSILKNNAIQKIMDNYTWSKVAQNLLKKLEGCI